MEFNVLEIDKKIITDKLSELKEKSSKDKPVLNTLVTSILENDTFIKKLIIEIVETYVVLYERGNMNAYKKQSTLSNLLTKRENTFESEPYFKSKTDAEIKDGKVIGKIIIVENREVKKGYLDFIVKEAVEHFKSIALNEELKDITESIKEMIETSYNSLYENASAMFSNDSLNDRGKDIIVALLFSAFGAEALDVTEKYLEVLEISLN